jgi:D-serine deaminase-like pyridoxal phosphate-dependent protein
MRDDYAYYRDLFRGRPMPLAFLDREALDRNVDAVRGRADGLPVRVASKSVRCRAVLEDLLGRDGLEGVMSYDPREAAWLSDEGLDDLLVAYPAVDEDAVRAVAERVDDGALIRLMVDCEAHVDRIAAVADAVGAEVPVCIDLDMSVKYPGVHFGVQRSPVRSAGDARVLAEHVADASGVRLDGLMGYEAQIAGLPDRSPANNAAVDAVIRTLKKRSASTVIERRERAVERIESEVGELAVVNGGGTGSLEVTRDDDSVTEVTVGSGFYAPALFDGYDAFQHEPAAGYAVAVVREPERGVYTCSGGGYVSSGPADAASAPVVHMPRRASLTDQEGAGEVQTPIEYGGDLSLGDPVVMRHAKAGELCRTFDELLMVEDGAVAASAPTYRGEGETFL